MNQRTMLISANLRQVDINFKFAVEGNVIYDAFLLQHAEQFCTLDTKSTVEVKLDKVERMLKNITQGNTR